MKTLVKWSVDDYHRMIEVGILSQRQVELREGEIIEVAPEGPLHYILGDRGSKYLESILQGRAYIRHVGPITLAKTERSPDIAIVRLPEVQYRQRHPSPDDIYWSIEVSDSTLSSDLNEKKRIYAKAGIAECWVINVASQQLIVFCQPQGDDYLIQEVYTQGTISPLAFPEVIISVEKLITG